MSAGQALMTVSSIATVGFMLGCLRWHYDRLGPGMLTHSLFNAVAAVVLFTV
jgi:membrane protease YdiL (CAAX protease family)